MSEEELSRFIKKVKDLNDLVKSLEKIPSRKALLASCKNHKEVIILAKSWGYNIGRRWGDE
ncbi:Nif11 family protein [Prochlorococcus sp. MIT 1307]|uniref:Nif11 family protein n=1 Tax=Prochlorococcus sp. MIT 1307 TaxID=3096219 RepID=UPI002A7566C8|nr:Nif11 family protein [Prochlorococcus sp. MIT 1307]